jgi:hypothetical protein
MALELINDIYNGILLSLESNLGNVAKATIIILIGWVLGKVLGTLIKRALEAIKIDKYFKIEEGVKLSSIVSVVVTWIIYLVFIQTSLDQLGIVILTQYFGQVVDLIQSLLGAGLILIVGYFIAKHGQNYFSRKKHEYAKIVSQLVFFFTMVISLSIALEVVGLSTTLINNIILIMVASVGLGMAIAIGLGLKDTVKSLAKKYEKKL